ncbi:lysophospholipid acyltransferase family protein [Candidatus Clostridium radicumherbarum]|jgi:1-acyl-sn-glycerol-3-phosphate acyltransferases|uniref:1-acyl-sn-glycerol-3-phosphate acyltransferase n=1 Tax=Candidatus Clostridium radicumherbarum TaxID=3381662 RepID=A0ABW8U0I4_9CLOT
MLRTILWFIWFGVSLILTLPFLLIAKLLDWFHKNDTRDKFVYKVTSIWAKSQVAVSGSKIRVSGEENLPKGPVLFISNHQSNFDIPIFMSFINKPKAFIAKIETAKIPLVASWMRLMRCVFMDRKDIRQSVEAINKGAEFLKQGYSMVIFPEGTRSKTGEIGEFKAGSFKLAVKSGVSIVPVAISGSINIMDKESIKIKPALVKIEILKSVEVSELSKEEQKNLHITVQELIQEAIRKNNG